MAPPQVDAGVASTKRPRSRKSIAHMPSPDTVLTTDKENMTLDTSALAAKATSKLQKRSRSKSLGPGGIDALQEDSGNRGKGTVAAPRSILKPAIPLSPLKEIPVRKPATQAQSPTRSPTRKNIPIKTQGRAVKEATQPLLGAHVTSPKKAPRISPKSSFGNGADPLDNEAVEQEKRRVEKEEAIKQRDARRKSMANRRVSFAPEATLHTWDMLEDMNDATSSTATSASARRASEISNGNDETHSGTMDDILVAGSPAERQEAKERRKRRRSSGIPPMNFNNPDDAASSSPATGSSDAGDEDEEDELSPEKVVGQNLLTPELEDAILRGSNGHPEQDDDGDMSMEMANEEITVAFKPWAKQMLGPALDSRHLLLPPEQENINPFSPAFKGAAAARATSMSPTQSNIGDGDMSMDITQAIGGIIAQKPAAQRQSVRNRRRSSASSAGGETMEFTMAVGGIKAPAADPADESHADTNEDLSMEFTAALGGILNANPQQHAMIMAEVADDNDDNDDNDDGDDMEMTTALGGIYQRQPALQDIEEETGNMDMEMTTAFGSILASQATEPAGSDALPPRTKPQTSSPLRSAAPLTKRKSIVASETGSPTITTKSPRTRAHAAKTENMHSTPPKSPSTPSARRSTPRANRPIAPAKTPPTKSTSMQRESTPKKLFQEELSASKKTGFTPIGGKSLRFDATAENTLANAFGFMSPAKRRMSGFGIEKEGLGSPRVAALLDRRTSIGDQASPFTPSKAGARVIRFEDPKIMEAELIRDHHEQERHESGQYIIEQEAEGDEELDHTATLKEAIGNMTPKKTPQRKNLKGRKSLAPGGALGLLGKRPLELDESDNEGTPEGYRGREGSPVKKIRLQAPPTKTETLGRIAKPDSARASTPLIETAGNAPAASTPKHTGHFKDAESLPSAQKPLPTMGQESVTEEDLAIEEEVVEKIHLQDFLNLTSIRFMELNTTKRRHTIMPTADAANGEDEVEADPAKQFEDAVVAQACTVPMLELFQHSCRECKKYIAEGRGVIREIEADTFEENPLLFREYMSAAPADRTVMDNQFKQMKTNARLISKGQWYAWRMQLLDGLKENLNSTAAEFSDDDALLTKHEQAVQGVLPDLLHEHAKLEEDCAVLQEQAGEFDSSQQGELDEARDRLMQVCGDISDKRALIEKYKAEKQAVEDAMAHAQQEKLDCQQAIQEAQRVREELRGWSAAEVDALKAKVDALETQHGWRITSASDNALTMTYRNDLQLFFTPSAFASNSTSSTATATSSTNAPISLTYIGDSDTLHRRPVPLPTHSRFFLQFLRAHLQCLSQSRTTPRALLNFVSTGWDKACSLDREVRALSFAARTVARIRSDEVMDVTAVVVLKGVSTKLEVGFEVTAAVVGEDAGMEMVVNVRPRARVVYGEMYKEDRMTEFVRGKVEMIVKARAGGKGEGGQEQGQQWTDAVRDLRRKLVAQGRKG